MKNKSSNHGLSYFFRQRIDDKDPDHMLKWVRPDSEVEGTEAVLENILRWEDDGDKTLRISNTHEQ